MYVTYVCVYVYIYMYVMLVVINTRFPKIIWLYAIEDTEGVVK